MPESQHQPTPRVLSGHQCIPPAHNHADDDLKLNPWKALIQYSTSGKGVVAACKSNTAQILNQAAVQHVRKLM